MSSELTPVNLDKEPKPIQWSEDNEKGKPETAEAEDRGQKVVAERFEKIRSTLSKALERVSGTFKNFKAGRDFTAAASDISIKTFSSIYGGPNKLAEWFGDPDVHLSDVINPNYSAIKDKAIDGIEAITAGYAKAIEALSNRFDAIDTWRQGSYESLGLNGAKKAQAEFVPENSSPTEALTEESAIAQADSISPAETPAPGPSVRKPISFGESLVRFMKDDSTGQRIDAEQLPLSRVVEANKVEVPAQEYKALNVQEMQTKMEEAQAQIYQLLESDTSINPATDKSKMEKIIQLQKAVRYYRNALAENEALSSSLDTNSAAGQEQESNRGKV